MISAKPAQSNGGMLLKFCNFFVASEFFTMEIIILFS